MPETAQPAQRQTLIDPKTLMRIKSLQVRARVVVQGFYAGLHRSPYHGFSVEFSEYRQYAQGDDPRYIDWKLFARSDRHYIKRFEDETNLRCSLLVDLSRSMGFGSQGYTKAAYATTLAATLAYFLNTQRDAVGLLTFDEELREYLPARYRPGHLHQLMVCLERTLEGKSTNLAAPLERVARVVNKRGLMVVISDLLAPTDALETNLGYLTSRGHEVVLLRVLDPAELEFDFDQPALFEDLESGRELYVDPETTRSDYLRRFQEHHHQIERICNSLGVDYYRFPTSRPLELALPELLSTRLRRGRKTLRRGANSRRTA